MSNNILSLKTSALLSAALLATGCTALESTRAYVQDEEWDPYHNDPFETENRMVYAVNSTVDRIVLEPTARAYTSVTPEPVQGCVSNFFSNLREPLNSVSHALALNRESASSSLNRFLINTVVGAAGCVDVADGAGLEEKPADLGLAVRSWRDDSGEDQSLYLVVPILGPSSAIDAPSSYVGRTYVHPFNFPYGKREDGEETRSRFSKLNPYGLRERSEMNSAAAVEGIDTRAGLLDATDLIREVALDEYSFVRDAYLEQRAAEAEELRRTD